MNRENIIIDKSHVFALKIISLYKELIEKKEFVLSKQLLRSGTSIGANINESQSAESNSDFIHKLQISLKESREVIYWLNLLKDSKFIEIEIFDTLNKDCKEIQSILTSIILKMKEKGK